MIGHPAGGLERYEPAVIVLPTPGSPCSRNTTPFPLPLMISWKDSSDLTDCIRISESSMFLYLSSSINEDEKIFFIEFDQLNVIDVEKSPFFLIEGKSS